MVSRVTSIVAALCCGCGTTTEPARQERQDLVDVARLADLQPVASGEENDIAARSRRPWALSREEWLTAGSPDLGIDWSVVHRTQPTSFAQGASAERAGINDFMALFADPVLAVKVGRLGPEENKKMPAHKRVAADRQEAFAKQAWHPQTTSSVMPQYGLEDAREAILIGRKLGYFEADILHYVVKNYLPEAFEAIDRGVAISAPIRAAYPALYRGNAAN